MTTIYTYMDKKNFNKKFLLNIISFIIEINHHQNKINFKVDINIY